MIANCKLCQLEGELRNSHIVPEFAFSPIYDEKHRLVEVSTDPTVNNRLRQKGIRERLLCQTCETKFSVWERYASDIWHRGGGVVFNGTGRIITAAGIDYCKFKLFQMSILWRAGVSSIGHFAEVQLGRRHEERLRQMLLSEDSGEEYQYGCAIIPVVSDDIPEKLLNAFLTPDRSRIGGHAVYRFFFESAFWMFCVSSHSSVSEGQELFLTKRGTLKMILHKAERMPYFQTLAGVLREQEKLRARD